MLAARYLALVLVLVAMGLTTVWWKSRTLAMGYEAARLERQVAKAVEEQRVEELRLARLTAPERVAEKVKEMDLKLESRAEKIISGGRRPVAGSMLASAGKGALKSGAR
ncbi:MAG TPA: hypothetical protein PK280_15340 [Planctomycetota bacterium]|nr:hypothetical protein [Planctomycetota bacterium]